MRGTIAAAALACLIGASCTGGGNDPPAASPGPSTSTSPVDPTTPPPPDAPACALTPAPGAGEATFVAADGRLVGVAPDGTGEHCLVAGLAGRFPGLSWAAGGDRLLLGSELATLPAGPAVTGFGATDKAAWSRPTGRAVLAVTPEGRLVKRPIGGGGPEDVTFLDRHESALYHPAGRAIASIGDGPGGYGIYLGDNRGRYLGPVVDGEGARRIESLAWTVSGALVFAAEHDDRWHVHRVVIGAKSVTTLATTDSGDERITALVASTFPGGGVAWRQEDCAAGPSGTHVNRGNRSVTLPAVVDSAQPVGWLPDGALVLADRRQSQPCNAQAAPADLFAFKDGQATKIASATYEASVRSVLPSGPELPASIPDTAPA